MAIRKVHKIKHLLLIPAGLMMGAVNGLLGGGGGMIAVPTLRYLAGLDTKRAHATAIGVMLPLSIISAIIYTLGGVYQVKWGLLSALTVSVGGLLGSVLLARLNRYVVSLVFYLLMLAAGIRSVVLWFG